MRLIYLLIGLVIISSLIIFYKDSMFAPETTSDQTVKEQTQQVLDEAKRATEEMQKALEEQQRRYEQLENNDNNN
ncbi:MAG: hypothetical protein PVG75_01455 [Thioalkalispiraceae bacterium]|jgi:hypothetical protein